MRIQTRQSGGSMHYVPAASQTQRDSSARLRADDVERPIHLVADDVPAERERRIDAAQSKRSELANRALNLTLALIAIVLISPVLVIVALAVWLTSPGPILHVQVRVGLDRRGGRRDGAADSRRQRDLGGRVFLIYKFRSMYVDAERRSGAVWAKKGDPRITPLGRYMRKLRIDELPQLFNVVLGDMNIVGPRPERPTLFAELRDAIDEYPLRQRAKPGITGWAQINQSYDSCLADVRNKVRFDLEYIERQSVKEDLRIMLRTLPVMLFQRGGW